ncbi:AI-2E family transporter [Alkalihalobacterium elongatum]|uniref:AI-2E family transporter n=1 Tax=Alkalihalobacterium elongatum TaxID=2675466 RepID=UPI001C1F4F9E|nr:AI-2E family transporter [Alkalihalobacterium elongatum]
MENVKGIKWIIRLSITILVLLCIYFFLQVSPLWLPVIQVLSRVAIPLLIAAIITYLLHPIIENAHAYGLPRPLAVLIIYLLFFGGIASLITAAFPYVVEQLREFIENLPYIIQQIQQWSTIFERQISALPEGMQAQLADWMTGLEAQAESIGERILDTVGSILSSFIYFIVIPFLVFYLLKDYKLIEKVAWYVTPKKWRKEGVAFIRDVDQSLGNYIRGQILVSMSVGIIAMIGLWIIGVPYPIILGLFIGMTDIIPYFGAFLGAFPAIIVAALHSWQMLVFTVLLIFILQQIEGNILSPVIVGKSVHLHPILIMVALLIGVETAGILGLVLAVPVLSVVKVVLLHLRTNLLNH